ncbi:META domain-containing protein [Aequorivita todarodis]|uniref:META domain-containing protein n=1 Tax=Aequorivita todarodis TaxID=2036821 RepID=UPI002350BEAD|nr:META domain-containing protein [Aequorivita todarodis]MDC7999845.1 META domain-containing protein [Aequorivita todarodis]
MACGSKKEVNSSEQLYGTTWQLEYMSGPRIAFDGLFPNKKPEITFNKATSEVTGNNSCNGYSAKYTLNGKSISFGEPGPTTMMYCGEGEPQFLNMMKKINGYSFDADGKLNLMIGEVPMMRFKKVEKSSADNLEMANGKPVNTKSSYFIASGTEPFWSLEFNAEFIVYKTPTDSLKFPHTNPIIAQDGNVKRYDLESEFGKMIIQISQTACTNAMSGKVSPYSVTIEFKKETDTDFQKFEGCGHYITDYRLHDTWVLETLNGKTISKDDFAKEFPTMEINTAENKFMGFAGCNRMNGTLFFEKGLLRFTEIATTKMMCEPSNKEAEFLKALQSSTTYSIENNRLTLSNPLGILTVFKKID